MCGGTPYGFCRAERHSGLSPRVRGNPSLGIASSALGGSIPACAGEPQAIGQGVCPPGVYPRVCGGTGVLQAMLMRVSGLSPRVRGNRGGPGHPLAGGGSIPACAGEPAGRRPGSRRRWVYPRVCGGTYPITRISLPITGLSPRVRGNRTRYKQRQSKYRSIPACAGEPAAPATPSACAGVYPRVCGGTRSPGTNVKSRLGLSPRVRGNLPRRTATDWKGRSIPACAGEPAHCDAGL